MDKIERIWINDEKGDDNFIVINENIIYRLKAKGLVYDEVKYELSQGRIDKRLIGMPLSYVNTIEYRESIDKLKFNYQKDSVDIFKIKDKTIRKEIFDHIRVISKADFKMENPNLFKRSKGPLLALVVVLASFVFVYMTIELKKEGSQLESEGLFAFLIYFAEFGLIKNILGFSLITIFLVFRIWNNSLKNDEEVHILKFK
jgi:hypothetical protein